MINLLWKPSGAGQAITLESEFFGAYQPVRLTSAFYDTLKETRDAVLEKIASGTATEEELLSSKNGCPILTKTQKEELDTSSPVVLGNVTGKIEGRKIIVSANLTSDSPLKSCSVFMRNGLFPNQEPVVVSGSDNGKRRLFGKLGLSNGTWSFGMCGS